jgi:tRNA A-37 threonylcarbamoyl transferase component Bud32
MDGFELGRFCDHNIGFIKHQKLTKIGKILQKKRDHIIDPGLMYVSKLPFDSE